MTNRHDTSRPTGMRRTAEKLWRLDAVVRERFHLSWGESRARIASGKIFIDKERVTDIAKDTSPNADIAFIPDARRLTTEDTLLPKEAFRWVDRDVVVVEKPSDLLTVPFEPGDLVTLERLIKLVLAKREKTTARDRRTARPTLHVVHRLDRNTSGLLIFARTALAEESLKAQFKAHSVERRYLALVHGKMVSGTIESHHVSNRGDGIRGSVEHAPQRLRSRLGQGKRSVTHVEVLETFKEATFVACRLETGRTNQIRIHLSEAGHPLVGETVYLRGYGGPVLAAPRLCLHAETLGFIHPRTGETMRFSSPLPSAIATVIARARARS